MVVECVDNILSAHKCQWLSFTKEEECQKHGCQADIVIP